MMALHCLSSFAQLCSDPSLPQQVCSVGMVWTVWSKRARDAVELNYAELQYPKDIRNLFLDISQNPTHSKATTDLLTIHGNTVLFPYEAESIVLEPHITSFHGYPVLEHELWKYSTNFLKSVTGDSYFIPAFGNLMLAVYLNKHAAHWEPRP